MTFDRTRAMRNAERFVAQGKIKAAIAEYRSVVEHDPGDIATTNMLGDLLAKNSEKGAAVDCYTTVAEYYAGQGFAQKGIAIYNKISKLQPGSMAVTEKLAELYALKGSLSEARHHYTIVAEHHSKNGRRMDALAAWKQIARLDHNNTEVCVTLAESYLRERQLEEAAEAFVDAALRFARKENHEESVKYLLKGLEIRPGDLRILAELVVEYSAMGQVQKAVHLLEEILEQEPYNRDVLYLLVDCLIAAKDSEGAEKAVIKLVEIEPANYPKLIDLLRLHLEAEDLDASARVLSMSCEYLLAAGDGSECKLWIDEILKRESSHVAALRLLVRAASWLKDEDAFREALERLADAANASGEVDDERYALSHLVVIRPFETKFADRLEAINAEHGFSAEVVDEELLKAQFAPEEDPADDAPVEIERTDETVSAVAGPDEASPLLERNGDVANPTATAAPSGEARLQKELDSVAFYIENGYTELAEKTISGLEAEFGARDEISALRTSLSGAAPEEQDKAASFGIEDIRSEFGLDEKDSGATDDDFETHFHTAVAYQEMGLLEQAIGEFQDAIALVKNGDGTRRFFQCSNLLGHCFMAAGTPKHAITWFNRALETVDLSTEEKQGLWYELAVAFESDGNIESAARHFEQVYAENVDFRDVARRVKAMLVVQ